MQILFYTEENPQSYTGKNGKYPDTPSKCPICYFPGGMRKHGFYKRNIIIFEFEGKIYIRRYICPDCEKTVSMLPSFCIPYHQYGTAVIVFALLTAMKKSVRYAETKWSKRFKYLTRRHIIQYRGRIIHNRKYIQLGLNLISPGFIELKQIAGDFDWTRSFLEVVTRINPPQFNATYHKLTGKSFMSAHINVA